MKVKDLVTGNVLTSDQNVTTEGWLANAERFIPVEEPAPDKPKTDAVKKTDK